MGIRQFNIRYDPEQDRLVFRFNTAKNEEFRFHMTRRFVTLLWPVLERLVEQEFKKRAPERSYAAREMTAFERDRVLSGADFEQGYSESAESFPLGPEAILLTTIKVKNVEGTDVLCLFPKTGQGVEFRCTATFLHPFRELLKAAVKRADWGMKLVTGGEAADARSSGEPRVVH